MVRVSRSWLIPASCHTAQLQGLRRKLQTAFTDVLDLDEHPGLHCGDLLIVSPRLQCRALTGTR